MADEPEGPDDEPVETEKDRADAQVSALAELALCENLAQTSGWAARWSASMAGADATLLWAPDTVHPLFLCIGAEGEGVEKFLRRSAPRDTGYIRDLVRDRQPIVLTGEELTTNDPFVRGLPGYRACIAVPLEAEGLVVGLLAIFFTEMPDAEVALARLEAFLEQAAPALGRALRSERKTVGMLHAIERLTNLYDLSKAFGSTIDADELSELIVRKAADFVTGEAACLWILEGEDDVTVAAMAINENYEVESPPDHVGGAVVGDVIADQNPIRRNRIAESDPVFTENPLYPVRSLLAAPLVEDEISIGALVVANKRGRHPEFTAEDEELLHDIARQAVRALRVARQHEAEKKVEELDALLAVSREITSTLDLDKVMQTIVNATSALIAYDRCGLAILAKGKLRLGAISGSPQVDRKDPDVRRMEELLQWVFLSGTDASVTQTEDGEIQADRPETEEKFRAIFGETGLRSFFGVLLKDEEGKLGALGFESKEALIFDEETQDLLSILVNQATVSVRNAQLYKEVPLAGFWQPLHRKAAKAAGDPAEPAPRVGHRGARRRRRARAHPVAAARRRARPGAPGPARRRHRGRRRDRERGPPPRRRPRARRRGDRDAAGRGLPGLARRGPRGAPDRRQRGRPQHPGRRRRGHVRGAVAPRRGGGAARVRRGAARAHAAESPDRGRPRHAAHRPARGPGAHPRRGIRGRRRRGQRDRGGRGSRGRCRAPARRRFGRAQDEPVPHAGLPRQAPAHRRGAARGGRGELRHRRGSRRESGGALKAGMLGQGKVSAGARPLGFALFRSPLRYLWLKIWPLLP